MTEYRDKVEEEYQLEADTNAEESWVLFKIVVMRRDTWNHQGRETPGEGDLVVE